MTGVAAPTSTGDSGAWVAVAAAGGADGVGEPNEISGSADAAGAAAAAFLAPSCL